MKVLYDYQALEGQKFGGISRYYYEVWNRAVEQELFDLEVAVKYSHSFYVQDAKFLPKDVIHRHKVAEDFLGPLGGDFTRRAYLKLERMRVDITKANKLCARRYLKKQDYDIFHPTYFDQYFLKDLPNKPFVVTVYDMIHELFPEFNESDDFKTEDKKNVISAADRVIAISESTKQDLVKLIGYPEDQIDVIPLASSLNPEFGEEQFKDLGDYIMFISQRFTYKNFRNFIEAVAPILKHNDLKVICVGGGRFSAEEQELFEAQTITEHMVQMSPDDRGVAELYSKAKMLVYPSKYEGFGIPLLEAFSCGCAVASSNSSSLPEVGGDAAVYFDPDSIEDMRSSINELLQNEELRKDHISKGLKRATQFSWDKTAKMHQQVYQKLLA